MRSRGKRQGQTPIIVSGDGIFAINQPKHFIDINVYFHAEVPLVVFLGEARSREVLGVAGSGTNPESP
ncbi:hypothetical protein SAMN05216210_3307 [Halopseudomonas salegens]|uniref:Uncharacterized protein n=1 Tax=Halopseudomonas salegens TaxID=1434072 RepID=A0A1H2HTT3_9GAMM|nr:hypothetical protein SAMN05216210_3307 [Halopseudomonas salegens]